MTKDHSEINRLVSEMAPLGKEAEETLHAIVLGEADALVIETETGPRVYTLRDANEPYRRLVERMADAALLIENDGTIIYCNGRLPRMLARESVVGLNLFTLVSPDHCVRAERLLAEGAKGDAAAEMNLVAGNETLVGARATAAPLAFAERSCLAVVFTALDDIQALKLSESRLRTSEERLALAQTFARIATWWWDLQTGRTEFNAVYYELYGLPGNTPHSYEDFLALVHPDDRAFVDIRMKETLAGGRPYEIEYRVRRANDGVERWFSARGKAEFSGAGSPLFVTGVVYDITDRKRAELAQRASDERLQRLLETDAVGILFWTQAAC